MSFKKIFTVIVLIFFFLSTHAQNEAAHWYFGQTGINFISGNPIVDSITNWELYGAPSIICDTNGNMLFYASDNGIIDRNMQVMDINLRGCHSERQGSLILKKPGNDSLYYVFFADGDDDWFYFPLNKCSFRYNIVDINANNGLGGLIHKNDTIIYNTTEKITAVRHCNNNDIWVIVHTGNSNTYLAYLLTSSGIDTSFKVISNIGSNFNHNNDKNTGIMKASPNGKKIAVTHAFYLANKPVVEIFDFDNASGVLSNPFPIYRDSNYLPIGSAGLNRPYGVEFSPSMKYLYVSFNCASTTWKSHIYQYDLSSNNVTTVNQSATVLYDNYTYSTIDVTEAAFSLQLAPDNKIYCLLYGTDYYVPPLII